MINDSLTVAIPLYNESATIPYLKSRLDLILAKSNRNNLKILLVDDGSSDNTFQLLTNNFSSLDNCKIVKHEINLNLNGFLKTVIELCDTEFVVFLDSDCTFDPLYIFDMVELLQPNTDIVNGSPYHPQGTVEGVKKGRLLISNGANLIYKVLVDKNIHTYTSIFKLYRTSKIKNINLNTFGFVSVSELFIKCILNGANVIEYPCTLSIRKYGDSKIRIANSIKNHLQFMAYLFKIKLF
ncbi:MAG: glycosyl transferase [Gammaproteobacteria bacterium]|nr:glycosyl transferase [Gammaproteobacteria bacterium]|tara:strand:- start:302 stop:1018 length:717 start_codon:yes stop_codon:yes gene_type:complete